MDSRSKGQYVWKRLVELEVKMFRAAISLLFVTWLVSTPLYACVVAPTFEQRDRALRALINDADHVFIGKVNRIIRRRWGPDDEMGGFENRWLERKKSGRKIPGDIQNRLDFSEATGRLSVYVNLKKTDIFPRPRGRTGSWDRRRQIDIDLLNPFTVAGRGPCHSFPRTCPWNIKPGDLVAVAAYDRGHAPWWVTYCVPVKQLTSAERKNILELRKSSSADQVFWTFIEAARARSRALWDAKRKEQN